MTKEYIITIKEKAVKSAIALTKGKIYKATYDSEFNDYLIINDIGLDYYLNEKDIIILDNKATKLLFNKGE